MGQNLDISTCMIICTGFPTSCELKYDILVKKLINNHFKQPCRSSTHWISKLAVTKLCIQSQCRPFAVSLRKARDSVPLPTPPTQVAPALAGSLLKRMGGPLYGNSYSSSSKVKGRCTKKCPHQFTFSCVHTVNLPPEVSWNQLSPM